MTTPMLPVPAQQMLTLPISTPVSIYFNGYGVGATATDVVLILQNGQQVVAQVQATYTVMKALAESLAEMVEKSEKVLGIQYPDLREAVQKMQSSDTSTT